MRITEAQEAPRAGFIWIVPSDPHSPGGRGYYLDRVRGSHRETTPLSRVAGLEA